MMQMIRLAPMLSVAGAVALGVGAASAAGIGPIGGTLPAVPVSSPVLGNAVSAVTQPVQGAVSGATGAVQSLAAPAAPIVHLPSAHRPASTTTTSTTPPPPGHATANGAHVNPLDTCVSCTDAGAGGGGSQAGATGLRVLGQTLSGGSSSSTSSGSGNLIAVPANPLLGLALADWMTDASSNGGVSHARSRSSLVDLGLGDGQVATVAVLEAASSATFNGGASHGAGWSNGVHLTAGNGALVLILLHSEANSDGGRSAYLASLNGTTIGGSQSDGDIPITVPGVVSIHLLTVGANGGVAGATVGSVDDLLSQSGPVASVLGATASGATAPIAIPVAQNPQPPTTGVAGVAAGIPAAANRPAAPRVPLTGVSIGAAGILLLTSGLGLLAISARRRRHGETG